MSNISGFIKRLRDIMRNDAGINGDAQRIEQIAWLLFLKVYDTKEQDWEFEDDKYQSIIPTPCRWRNWAHEEGGKGMTGEALLNFVNNTLFPVLKGKDIKDPNGNVLIGGIQVNPDTPIKKAIVKTTFEDANTYMKDGVLLRQVINVIDALDLSDYEESHAFGEIYETILRELQSAGSSGEFYTPRAVTDFMAKMINPQIGERCADFACGTGGFLVRYRSGGNTGVSERNRCPLERYSYQTVRLEIRTIHPMGSRAARFAARILLSGSASLSVLNFGITIESEKKKRRL